MTTQTPATVRLISFDVTDLDDPLQIAGPVATVGLRAITVYVGLGEFRVRDTSGLRYLREQAAARGHACTVRITRRYLKVPACIWCRARPAGPADTCDSPQCRAGRNA